MVIRDREMCFLKLVRDRKCEYYTVHVLHAKQQAWSRIEEGCRALYYYNTITSTRCNKYGRKWILDMKGYMYMYLRHAQETCYNCNLIKAHKSGYITCVHAGVVLPGSCAELPR